jgi:hypothetical protein
LLSLFNVSGERKPGCHCCHFEVSFIKEKILSAGAFNSIDLNMRILEGIRNEMQVRTIEKAIALRIKSLITLMENKRSDKWHSNNTTQALIKIFYSHLKTFITTA